MRFFPTRMIIPERAFDLMAHSRVFSGRRTLRCLHGILFLRGVCKRFVRDSARSVTERKGSWFFPCFKTMVSHQRHQSSSGEPRRSPPSSGVHVHVRAHSVDGHDKFVFLFDIPWILDVYSCSAFSLYFSLQ